MTAVSSPRKKILDFYTLSANAKRSLHTLPPQSMGSSPTVSYYGCSIGERPTVIISSSSRRYSHTLKNKLKRSRTFAEYGFEFRCQSRDFSPKSPRFEPPPATTSEEKPWLRKLWWLPLRSQHTRREDEEKPAAKPSKKKQAGRKPQPPEIIYPESRPKDFQPLIDRIDQDAQFKALLDEAKVKEKD